MDFKTNVLLFSTSMLVVTSLVYGIKFFKRGNYLLGLEWLIVTFSGSNFLIFALAGIQGAYSISYFCDAFSRAFGIPIVTTLGLMAITHRFKPSLKVDAWLFATSFAGAVALVAVPSLAPFKPVFYVVMWTAFSFYLAYFAKRLFNAGEGGHAAGVIVVLILTQAIASIYDFYQIPGDTEHIVFYILAGLAWSSLCVELYYAYCALENAEQNAISRKLPTSRKAYV
ncbi:hypothetical protein GM658_05770 [Pseudoduganella eburnea]|uniref:Transporter n=1 Tax=Massilia eburnea TaxID=1776165 RepID=A0A6L6QDH1_9BURK|nr:hypothetical protein [Massilia eburnea]